MVRTTERFGAWVLDTRKGMIFGVVVTVLFAAVMFKVYVGSVVVLSSKDFTCSLAKPDGLATVCVEYVFRGK